MFSVMSWADSRSERRTKDARRAVQRMQMRSAGGAFCGVANKARAGASFDPISPPAVTHIQSLSHTHTHIL